MTEKINEDGKKKEGLLEFFIRIILFPFYIVYLLIKNRRKLLTIRGMTMIGVWIIVYYHITSHEHKMRLTNYQYQGIKLTWETYKNVEERYPQQ